jgi:dihydrofolate reductase
MARLIYSTMCSLDGYIADEDGNIDWSMPDERVHRFVNDLEAPIGTYLYGRRMYEVMLAWETMDTTAYPQHVSDYTAIWQAANKVVFSRTLTEPASARTRIEREFNPALIREWKATAKRDLSVGGAELAGLALRAGLVDDCHLFINPVMVGGGQRALPSRVRLTLQMVDEHRFDSGVVHLHYRLT